MLSANLDKSEVYFGGVSADIQKELRELLGVSQGTIPFRYLGVPLSSKKLTIAQCRPLVEKVTARIQWWMAKHLSYAGRLQLVKSVLFGIQTYWAQIFILPKKILKEIEARFRCFLWTRSSALLRNLWLLGIMSVFLKSVVAGTCFLFLSGIKQLSLSYFGILLTKLIIFGLSGSISTTSSIKIVGPPLPLLDALGS